MIVEFRCSKTEHKSHCLSQVVNKCGQAVNNYDFRSISVFCTEVKPVVTVLLHTGQAKKYAWTSWELNLRLLEYQLKLCKLSY